LSLAFVTNRDVAVNNDVSDNNMLIYI